MSPGNDHNPLTREHLQWLNQALVLNEKARQNLDRLKRAGAPDLDQAEHENRVAFNLASGLKREFFPNEP